MTVWCLFSVENDYNQPRNDLCCLWIEKPTAEKLSKCFNPNPTEERLEKLLQGYELRINGADYRIEEVKDGEQLD